MATTPSSFSRPPDAERLKKALSSAKFHARPAPPTAGDTSRLDVDDVRFALALRGWVKPQDFLPTGLDAARRVAVLDALATDCETSTVGGEPRWTLKDSVRRCTLLSRTATEVASALGRIPTDSRDVVTQALHVLYVGPVPDLTTLRSDLLRALATASEWSTGHAPHTVNVIEARRCAARAARDEHYRRTLSGGFFGRRAEVDQVRAFLSAPLASGRGLRIAWVWGPGGIGKSTLIAATALELLGAQPLTPIAHLDFDRSDLDPTRSTSLDLEVLRQVGGVDPGIERELAARRERIRDQMSDDLAFGFESARQSFSPEFVYADSKSILIGAFDFLDARQQPLILILDTCERIQAGGPDYWSALMRWLYDFSAAAGAPAVRALLCGRSNPASLGMGEPFVFTQQLADLTPEDSVALLRHRGVPAPVAREAARTFGGNPLVLQLVANLVNKSKNGEGGVKALAMSAQQGDFPPDMVQGLLYDRFLKHIEDPEARRYAHPGLILPEVTPELIHEVIAPVLGDAEMTSARAHGVFHGLAAATWLTEVADSPFTLRQHADVRRLMLRLMRSDVSAQARTAQLRARAIAFHSSKHTEKDRAFALYHRLMGVTAKEALAPFEDEDIVSAMRYLRPLIDDFPAFAQTYLQARSSSALGPDEALRTLPDAAWATYFLGEGTQPGYGERAVRTGDPMIPLNLWRRRPAGDPSSPPTFVLQALCDTGEWQEPVDVDRMLSEIDTARTDADSLRRLTVMTTMALVHRPGPLPPFHEQQLETIAQRREPTMTGFIEFAAIAAVAEAFGGMPIVPDTRLRDDGLASETRIFLVRLRTKSRDLEWQPHLDSLIAIQRDWRDRANDVLDARSVAEAHNALMSLDGAPLDSVNVALDKLRRRVRVVFTSKSPDLAVRVALLRGTTPEFYRAVRQALREAFVQVDAIQTLLMRLRPRLTICPRDLEPDRFAARAARDPVNHFVSLAQFADRARVLGSLLDIAHELSPNAVKLARIRSTWHAWDAALSGGDSSDWHSSVTQAPTMER